MPHPKFTEDHECHVCGWRIDVTDYYEVTMRSSRQPTNYNRKRFCKNPVGLVQNQKRKAVRGHNGEQ